MPVMQYRAFISYAHEDEPWASWLQRSLERYRIPRRLVGKPGSHGPVPRRFAPVFRDREDLSTATDLTAQVQSALEASDSLIVVCSPAAANSLWVNQEIRRFRDLGREDRIFCLIVDGDPESRDDEDACFPSALLENGTSEPLAADARKYADGKSLSKLKLIAGVLGLKLDDLRRRDQQRRNRVMAMATSIAFFIAVLMSTLAILAVKARNDAERAHAESMANYEYLFGDLREKLVEVGRLDILEDVGSFVSQQGELKNFQDLSNEELINLALAWRQLGRVRQERAEFEDAMAEYERSSEIFERLQAANPDNLAYLFEYSQAIFWVSYIHYLRGEYEQAVEIGEQYLGISERLLAAEPDNPDYLMEMAYSHGNLFNMRAPMVGVNRAEILKNAQQAVRYSELALNAVPEDKFYLSMLSESYADFADALIGVCDLGGAYRARLRNLEISRELLEGDPRNVQLRDDVANALSGLANMEAAAGNTDQAQEHYAESRKGMDSLVEAMPDSADLAWFQALKMYYQAKLLDDLGLYDQAWGMYVRLGRSFERLMSGSSQVSLGDQISYAGFLTSYAQQAQRRGDHESAQLLMSEGIARLGEITLANPVSHSASATLGLGIVRAWESGLGDIDPGLANRALAADKLTEAVISCEDAELAVMQATMKNDPATALRFARYLRQKGYWHPRFVKFCANHQVCGD